MLDLSCQTKLITHVKYRNVYSNQAIIKSGNKKTLVRGLQIPKLKCKVIFSGHGLPFIANGMISLK